MERRTKWYRDQRLWLELFVLANLACLAPDIYLAHSTNSFKHKAEWLPLIFSLIAPALLLVGIIGREIFSAVTLWRVLGHIVGWSAVVLGIAGLILHLESHFFQERTMASLVYTAPFVAPLAYTGIGLLAIMNRMVDADNIDWPMWVLFLALGGFVGNFILSLADHAQNGFFHATEWIPVVSSALAVGFLLTLLIMRVNQRFLRICSAVMLLQAVVGIGGFFLHNLANLHGPAPDCSTILSTVRHRLRRCYFPIWPCWRFSVCGCWGRGSPNYPVALGRAWQRKSPVQENLGRLSPAGGDNRR